MVIPRRRRDTRAGPTRQDLGSPGFFHGVARLLLAAGMRLSDRSAFGFLHTQLQVGWHWLRTLTVEQYEITWKQRAAVARYSTGTASLQLIGRPEAFSMPWLRVRLAPVAHRIQQRLSDFPRGEMALHHSWRPVRVHSTLNDSRVLQFAQVAGRALVV